MMILNMDNNPLQRLDIKCFSINGPNFKEQVWCLFHKDMWDTYLSIDGDGTFDPFDSEMITLINYIINDKVTRDSKQKSLIAKQLLRVVIESGRVRDPRVEYPPEKTIAEFLSENIALVNEDPDFK